MNNQVYVNFIWLSFFLNVGFTQGVNCEIFRSSGQASKHAACLKCEETQNYYQFSKKYQEILDEAIQLDPAYDPAYRMKSVAYLKSGDFITWYKLISKAVSLNPQGHLGGRAWCRYSFFRDYQGAIDDIEQLSRLMSSDIGGSSNGQYHLQFVRALSYKGLGSLQKALAIVVDLLSDPDYYEGTFDKYHLGVLQYELGNDQESLAALNDQANERNFAENCYYLGLVHFKLGNIEISKKYLSESRQKYEAGFNISENYNHIMDKVYLQDIVNRTNELVPKGQ